MAKPPAGIKVVEVAERPEPGDSSDAILAALGYGESAIIDLKVQGVVF
ncbi:MAG: hypothetical protein QM676_10600 [Novosphingobium sp.]